MTDLEQHESLPSAAPVPEAADASPAESDGSDEPYSIFGNRQRALIVFLVSVAATCT